MAFLDRSGGKDLIDPVLKAGLAQHEIATAYGK
jgi:hypothetical protein